MRIVNQEELLEDLTDNDTFTDFNSDTMRYVHLENLADVQKFELFEGIMNLSIHEFESRIKRYS